MLSKVQNVLAAMLTVMVLSLSGMAPVAGLWEGLFLLFSSTNELPGWRPCGTHVGAIC